MSSQIAPPRPIPSISISRFSLHSFLLSVFFSLSLCLFVCSLSLCLSSLCVCFLFLSLYSFSSLFSLSTLFLSFLFFSPLAPSLLLIYLLFIPATLLSLVTSNLSPLLSTFFLFCSLISHPSFLPPLLSPCFSILSSSSLLTSYLFSLLTSNSSHSSLFSVITSQVLPLLLYSLLVSSFFFLAQRVFFRCLLGSAKRPMYYYQPTLEQLLRKNPFDLLNSSLIFYLSLPTLHLSPVLLVFSPSFR